MKTKPPDLQRSTDSGLSDWRPQLDAAIDSVLDDMVRIRRHLHAHPEVSGDERETSLFLYQLLGDLGFVVRMGPDGRGVVADSTDNAQDLISFRADIDALRIHDIKEVEYRSQNEGVMHACGHDAHTAVVFGTLAALQKLRQANQMPQPFEFRGIFQPAEETCEGAREMIEVGALEGVDILMAVHVDPTRQVETIGVRTGVLTANCDEMRITVTGQGGHAARPHETIDPIAAAAQLINALYLYIPRVTDSQDAAVVTIGQINGGHNSNAIPEQVVLRGTIRTLCRNIRRQTMEHVCRLAHGIAETTRSKIEVKFGLSSDSVNNDSEVTQLFRTSAREILSKEAVEEIPRASMGSEDFAYYLHRVRGSMLRLGCASEQTGSSPLHTPGFDIDERALAIGARILTRSAILHAQQRRSS